MNYRCTIRKTTDGAWHARHESRDLGVVQVTAPTRDAAIEKIRGELQYRLELCPCSGESYQHLQIEITEI
jgi:hypothetical protein